MCISPSVCPRPAPPQVPQDEWGGYPGEKDDEIPCRRMRSSSYVKAMGDEESGESDSSPKTSPQKLVRPDALVKAIIRPRDLLDTQRYYTCSFTTSSCLLLPFLSCMTLFISPCCEGGGRRMSVFMVLNSL